MFFGHVRADVTGVGDRAPGPAGAASAERPRRPAARGWSPQERQRRAVVAWRTPAVGCPAVG